MASYIWDCATYLNGYFDDLQVVVYKKTTRVLLVIQTILWCQTYAIYLIYDIVEIIGTYIAHENECS